jgi:hypothetical protein
MANRRSPRTKQRAHLQQSTPQARVRIAEFSSFEMVRAGGGPLFFMGSMDVVLEFMRFVVRGSLS